jgi:hypothetical protein
MQYRKKTELTPCALLMFPASTKPLTGLRRDNEHASLRLHLIGALSFSSDTHGRRLRTWNHERQTLGPAPKQQEGSRDGHNQPHWDRLKVEAKERRVARRQSGANVEVLSTIYGRRFSKLLST